MIRIENLSKTYNGREYVLKEINLEIAQGSYVEIVGKSGSGKSTFLNTLGLLDSDYEGKIFFDDIDISEQNDEAVSRIRNERIGFIFQAYHLIPHFTVMENILLPVAYSHSTRTGTNMDRVKELTNQLQITHLMNQRIDYLSGGEKQRAAIARALVLSPEIVLADEPTGNLDSSNSEIVFQTLSELKKEGTTVILVTHNCYVDVGADSILTLEKGRFV